MRIGYLDHCLPTLAEVTEPGDIVVPLLLSTGYHAAVDIPAAVPAGCAVTPALGPDRRLADACMDRLQEAGWQPEQGPVALAAAGSSDLRAAKDVAAVARALGERLRVDVVPAVLSAGSPRLADVADRVAAVATYLIAPGRFADEAAACGAPVVSGVLGDHPALAEIVVDRFAAATGA